MDKKIFIAIFLALVIISAGTLVIVLGNDGVDEISPVTVVDAEGRNVTTEAAPTSIVSCAPSLTELVYSLGMGDLLVGVTTSCNYPSDVNTRLANGSLVTIGGYWTPTVEAIVDTNASIVLMDQGVPAQLALIDQLELLGMTVVVMYQGSTIDQVFDNIELMGKICWVEDAADDLVDDMNEGLEVVENTIDGSDDNATVAFCCWLDPIYAAGNDTYVHEMIVLAGGVNSFESSTAWPTISMEGMLDADPDYIIVTGMMYETSGEAVLQYLRNDSLWSTLTAVQNNHVYVFVNQAENVFNRPCARLVEGVQMLAMILHNDLYNVTVPNVFSDDYADWLKSHIITDVAIDVEDSLGRAIEALDEGSTIVSLEPSITELVYSLGLDGNLVGVSSNCNYPANVSERVSTGTLATIGTYNKPNIESIGNLTPDLVLLDGGVTGHLALMTQLDTMNITYIVMYEATSIGSIYNNIELLGNVMGEQSTAHVIIADMADTISNVTEAVSEVSRDVGVMFSIYFAIGGSVWVAGNDTFTDSTIGLAAGVNVFGDVGGYYTVSPEAVLDADPDVIIITDSMAAINVTALWAYLESDPIWSQVTAVQEHQVYVMTLEASNIFNRPSVRVADSVNLLAVTLYPELFGMTSLPEVFDSDYADYL